MRSLAILFAVISAVFIMLVEGASAQNRRDIIVQCYRQGADRPNEMTNCSGFRLSQEEFTSCWEGDSCLGEPPLQTPREIIAHCYNRGADNPDELEHCSGFQVSRNAFESCRNGGPCFDTEDPNQAVGVWTDDPHEAQQLFEEFLDVSVKAPPGFDRSPRADQLGLRFAAAAIPDPVRLASCHDQTQTKKDFFYCIAEFALPEDYKLTRDCLWKFSFDVGAAAVCSSGSEDNMDVYQSAREVQQCVESEGSDRIAWCLGAPVLGKESRYYLQCISDNNGEWETAAVCALAKDLNPEQQIALSCAISTGGAPQAFASCTAGRLTAREINKCWENGVGTNDGCFGPNNELVRAARAARDKVCKVSGENSAVCDAYTIWSDNVVAPGQNHEVVRALNNAVNDVRNGPGENNELVKAGREIFSAVGISF